MPPCAQLALDAVAIGERGNEASHGHGCGPAWYTRPRFTTS